MRLRPRSDLRIRSNRAKIIFTDRQPNRRIMGAPNEANNVTCSCTRPIGSYLDKNFISRQKGKYCSSFVLSRNMLLMSKAPFCEMSPCLCRLLNLTSLAYILMHKITPRLRNCWKRSERARREMQRPEIIPHGLSDDGGLIESGW